jgi:cytochrome c
MRASLVSLCLVGLVVVAIGLGLTGEHQQRQRQAWRQAAAVTRGDPALGQGKVTAYGCGGCHEIPGVEGSGGRVGPSLKGFAGRTFVAGRLTNTPTNVQGWVAHPHRVDPRTAMPELGVTPADARDITAYLYTLR